MSPRGDGLGPRTLDAAVLRIRDGRGTPVGAGFLVTGELAFTCAHVVTAALGTPKGERPGQDARVGLDLPLSGSRESVTASVEEWSGDRDIAVLRLDEPLPDAGPVRLVRADEVWHHPIRAFGFPVGREHGVWHSGRLLDRQGGGWIQTEMTSANGYRVTGGFSGGPVWDEHLAGVVGMVVAAESKEPAAAYLIPADELLSAWPELALPAVPESPFRPLAAFDETAARFFFGRERETSEVAELVRGNKAVALVGPSGSGKSSLAMAGVVPLLRREGYEAVVLRPASSHGSPPAALAAALLPLLEPGLSEVDSLEKTQKLAAVLRGDSGPGLHSTVTSVLNRTGARRLLLVVDQCEEALAAPAEEVTALADLLAVGSLPDTVRVLITLRADFLDPVLATPSLGPLAGHRIHALRPMDHDQLREVITRPVAGTPQVSYEKGLDDRILRDTGDAPGALPLLVMALDLLWREQTGDGRLTYEAYERIGGVTGALRREADRAWTETVADADEPAARRLFTRLVQVPVAGTGAVARRPAARAELAPAEWEIAQRLAATRLLVTGGAETVELAHEALITAWPKLAAWVTEDHEFLAWRENLRLDLSRWRGAGEPVELLPSALVLASAQRWLTEREADLGGPEREFLERGRRRRRSVARRRRGLFSTIGLVSVLALVLGVLFDYQREVSEERQAEANSRALASTSTDQRLQDPALAIKLALAAYRTSPTDEAKNTLLRYYAQYGSASRILSGFLGTLEDFRASEDGNVMLARTSMGRATLFVHALDGTVRTQQLNGPPYAMYPLVSGDGSRVGYVRGGGLVWYDVRPDDDSPAGEPQQLASTDPEITNGLNGFSFAQLSRDGRLFAAGSGSSLAWWDLDRREFGGRIQLPQARGGRLLGVWFGPDDNTLIVLAGMTADYNQRLMLVDRRTGAVRVLANGADETVVAGDGGSVVTCKGFLQDGDESDSAVYTGLRMSDGSVFGRYVDKENSACDPVALGQGGRHLVIGLITKTLVDLPRAKALTTFQEPQESSAGLVSHARLVGEGSRLSLITADSTGIYGTETSTSPAEDMKLVELTPDGRRTVGVPANGATIQLRTATTDMRVLARQPRLEPYWTGDDPIAFTRDGRLLAHREGVNKVVVRDTKSLRRLSVITTAMPPTPAREGTNPYLDYFFDRSARLVTVAGTLIQRWNGRTGRAVDDHDLEALGSVAAKRNDPDYEGVFVISHPDPDRVTVVVRGDPYVRVVELPGGRQTARYRTDHDDLMGAAFDPSGRYLTLLRRSQVVELWRTDPLRKELGPLPAFGIPAVMSYVEGTGRFLMATNNRIRIYRVGERDYEVSLDLGAYSESSHDPPAYKFTHASRDGQTLLFYQAGSSQIIRPLSLRPDSWAEALCRVLGDSDLTPEEREGQPVPVPFEPVCP
ncbi:trypsin-like peptidase domain-containing protein [Streptomyces sp. ATCC 21386]|uniref:nSTAND1 domain-containing NTPase n=1 Tax=Streptomyces sp. ATCC 21386 TaxID=2699428 RepID=UPI001BFF1E99|nr:trypsin-like peptidase domain-containing protein [Streptomyces sp. ATCC 21386]